MVRLTSNKQSLLHNMGIAITEAGRIIEQRIDIDRTTVSAFEEQYADIYEYLNKNVDELSNSDQMIKDRIRSLDFFSERIKLRGHGFGGIIAGLFNLHSESKDVGKLLKIHSNLSVIKMLIENS